MPKHQFFTPLLVTNVLSNHHTTAGIEVLAQHFKTIPNEILRLTNEDGFKIEQARTLQTQLGFAASELQPRAVVVEQFQTATIPAQNALLKLLEEPPAYTQLMLITTSLTSILETIVSRCTVVHHTAKDENDTHKEGQILLQEYDALFSLTLLEKIKLAEQLKERDSARTFCAAAITHFHTKLEQQSFHREVTHTLQILLTLHQRLEANCNPQLVVEAALFSLPNQS